MGRNFLTGRQGDVNALLAASGYKCRRLLASLAAIWRVHHARPAGGDQ